MHRQPCSRRHTASQADARHRRRGGSSGRIAQYAAGRGSRASVAWLGPTAASFASGSERRFLHKETLLQSTLGGHGARSMA